MAYDWQRDYDWNYDHPPQAPDVVELPVPGNWDFCGLPVRSPLGMAAGPLLNSRWIGYYARLGFDVLTYKTVRSQARASYPPPNLLPVGAWDQAAAPCCVAADGVLPFASWAISFGMPSRHPDQWRPDVERARQMLQPGQVLSVSVVATPQADWGADQMAEDFAHCARWAVDSGAQAIEANFSCPNVCTAEGEVYLQPQLAGQVAAAIRQAIGQVPLIIKIGPLGDDATREELVRALDGRAHAISTTNTAPAQIRTASGELLFDGQRRGIGGSLITDFCRRELETLRRTIQHCGSTLRLISVGGVSAADEVFLRLELGAHHVQLATAAMLDPQIGRAIRRELAGVGASPPGR